MHLCLFLTPKNKQNDTQPTEVHPHPPFLLGFFLFSCFTPWVITPATSPAGTVQMAKMVTEMKTSPLPIPFQGLRRKGIPSSTAVLWVSPWPELRVEGKAPTPGTQWVLPGPGVGKDLGRGGHCSSLSWGRTTNTELLCHHNQPTNLRWEGLETAQAFSQLLSQCCCTFSLPVT